MALFTDDDQVTTERIKSIISKYNFTASDRQLALNMMSAWTTFAKQGWAVLFLPIAIDNSAMFYTRAIRHDAECFVEILKC